jgi:hypothetical protein
MSATDGGRVGNVGSSRRQQWRKIMVSKWGKKAAEGRYKFIPYCDALELFFGVSY